VGDVCEGAQHRNLLCLLLAQHSLRDSGMLSDAAVTGCARNDTLDVCRFVQREKLDHPLDHVFVLATM
jgi:hypothetical protein